MTIEAGAKGKDRDCLEKWHEFFEILSFLAIIATLPWALYEYQHRESKERLESVRKDASEAADRMEKANREAESTYRTVDDRNIDFLKLAVQFPELDLYSVPMAPELQIKLTEAQKTQQKLLYTVLTDIFEVAYYQYHKNQGSPNILKTKMLEAEWPGWESYIRKFLARPAYRATWFDVRDEYDKDFVGYMDTIVPPSPSK